MSAQKSKVCWCVQDFRTETFLLACPLVCLIVAAVFQSELSAFLSYGVLLMSLVGMILVAECSGLKLKYLVLTSVFAALACAGRILFAPFPGIKPVSALCIMTGILLGRRSGFLAGVLAALLSNFFFGQGLWTLWQMYAWGSIGWIAGVLAAKFNIEAHPSALYTFAFASGLLFGFCMNTWHIVGFLHPFTWQGALLVYAAGLPFDITHALATLIFLLLIYKPWKQRFERIIRRFELQGV